jgi:serine/threonine protein phosphatase PrpC
VSSSPVFLDHETFVVAERRGREGGEQVAPVARAVLRVSTGTASIAWVGDVRVYRLRGNDVTLQTPDPTFVEHEVTMPTESGDVFALVTAGVANALGEALLGMTLRARRLDPNACARDLIDDAVINGNGGIDDLTAVVVRVGPKLSVGNATQAAPFKSSRGGMRTDADADVGGLQVPVVPSHSVMLGFLKNPKPRLQ